MVARVCFWALLALIVAGIVLIFVPIPDAALAYSVIGLVIFAGFTMFDFQRLRRNADISATRGSGRTSSRSAAPTWRTPPR